MKLLTHFCEEHQLEEKKRWLTDEVGLTVFRVRKIFSPMFSDVSYQIVVIVMDDDVESFLKLKYPPGTFQDFTS